MNTEFIKAMINEAIYQSKSQPVSIQTTDATPAVILSVEISEYTQGIFEAYIVGVDETGSSGIAGKVIVSFFKSTTLTIDTPQFPLPISGALTGTTFSVDNVGENIQVTVTGVAGVVINWYCEPKTIQMPATSLP
jgi:hypothetical protein